MVLCGERILTVHGTVIYTAYPPFLNSFEWSVNSLKKLYREKEVNGVQFPRAAKQKNIVDRGGGGDHLNVCIPPTFDACPEIAACELVTVASDRQIAAVAVAVVAGRSVAAACLHPPAVE